jgi:EAL and modified HD-GYP domain-containing signal transduction protein
MMSGASEKSSELMITAMVRAKMCELVAEAARQEATDSYFTAGLLSVLEALFDAPMEQILEQLPLTPELRLALTDPKADSRLARTLQASVAFEEGNWSKLEMVDGGDVDLGASYVNALDWAEQARRSLAA